MSKGRLLNPRGMNLDVLGSHEFEGLDRYWYRVELYRGSIPCVNKGKLESASYRRERGNWIPFAGNQQTAMEIYRMKMDRIELEAKIREYESIEISYKGRK